MEEGVSATRLKEAVIGAVSPILSSRAGCKAGSSSCPTSEIEVHN